MQQPRSPTTDGLALFAQWQMNFSRMQNRHDPALLVSYFSLFLTQEHAFSQPALIDTHPSISLTLSISFMVLNNWDQGWPLSCGTSIIKAKPESDCREKGCDWLWIASHENLSKYYSRIWRLSHFMWCGRGNKMQHTHTVNTEPDAHLSEAEDGCIVTQRMRMRWTRKSWRGWQQNCFKK